MKNVYLTKTLLLFALLAFTWNQTAIGQGGRLVKGGPSIDPVGYRTGTHALNASAGAGWARTIGMAGDADLAGGGESASVRSATKETRSGATVEVFNRPVDQYRLEVFPNPTTEYVCLRWQSQGFEPVTIVMADAQGKEIETLAFEKRNGFLTISLRDWTPGVYHMKVKTERMERTEILVID